VQLNRGQITIGKAGASGCLAAYDSARFALRLGVALACILAIGSATALRVFAQRNPRDGSSARFVYLFGPTGAFVKLNAESGEMEAYWMLYRTEGALTVLPRCREGATVDAGCNLIWGRLQVAQDSGRIYGVFPVRSSQTQRDDTLEYQVAVFQLPELNLVGSLPIPQSQPEPPVLLLTPDGNRFFLSFRDPKAESQLTEPSIASLLEVYDASSLKKLSNWRDSAAIKDITALKAVLNTSFGEKAYFSADGKTIFDGLDVIEISGASPVRRYVNPLEKLSQQQLALLKDFEKIDPATQRPWLDFAAGDSAAGRTVVHVANALFTRAAYWTVDLRTGMDSPIIIAPFGPAHLTPDGKTLLLRRATVKKNANGAPEINGESDFRLYDVASGKQTGQFENPALAGPLSTSRLLCISPSGNRAFFSSGKSVHVVGLPDGRSIREVGARSLEAAKASCVFAGE
jgi:hypothetical protein